MTERIVHGSDSSPYARMVRIVLAELELPFRRDTRLTTERSQEEMARLNPTLRVPILEEPDGRVLHDSRVIVEYLLASFPLPADGPSPPLLPIPVRPEHRWDDALLTATLYNMLEGAVTLRQMGTSGVKPEQAPYLGRHQARIHGGLDWLEDRADPTGLLPGWFSVQDVALVALLDFGEHFGTFQWRGHPGLEALHARLSARSSVAGTKPG